MDVKDMSKKEFKKYINDNGFFVTFGANSVDKEKFEENRKKTGKKVPKGDNILLFEGIASQNYALGEKNRNGYKIDQKGWDFKNYMKNPVMLLQHNHEYGGVGHSVMLDFNEDGHLVNTFYVDLNTLDEKTRYQVQNGYITAVSTSHITHEDMIEDNETGERMTWSEAMEEGVDLWNIIFGTSKTHTLVVTKAEMIENSLVTIGSNEDAIVSHNSVGNYFTNKYINNMKLTKEQKEELLKNSTIPSNIKEKLNEVEVEEEKEEPSGTEDSNEDKPNEEEPKNDSENNSENPQEENKETASEDEDKPSENDGEDIPAENAKPAENAGMKVQLDVNSSKLEEMNSLLNELKESQKTEVNSLKEKVSVLEDALTLSLDNIVEMQKSMKELVVNGVSTFVAPKEKKENKLTQSIAQLKGM